MTDRAISHKILVSFPTGASSFAVLIGVRRVPPPVSPSHSNAFRSLNNVHLNFPSSARDDRHNNNPSSQNSPGTLSFAVEASSIHGLTGINSVARGNSITISSEHRNVHVNLAGLPGVSLSINFISGDNFFGAISGGNVGGRNNINTSVVTPAESWLP
ncbi:hypothetical protein BDN71DRAFT_1453142 [Pleurotus eryngii]|uniref:Uncharacterized protein n=1 Tax=Pleurotus eryngii TaxID=5323 RepID=A0A9P5ZSY8_PLEER|nr:hypothetical protein BDN71DRAFT_1453142 [Pleurotus eryngii]